MDFTLQGRRASVIVAALACLFAAGCATESSTSSAESPAFRIEPYAPTPRLQIQWRQSVDVAEVGDYQPQQFAAPLLIRASDRRELVVGTSAGQLYRVRAGDGKVRWSTELDGPIHARPVADAGKIFVGTIKGTFYAIDRTNGEVAWKVDNDRGMESPAAAGRGLVLYTTNADRLVAVDQSSGEIAWSYNRSAPKEFTVKGSGTPTIRDGVVYCGFADGVVAALELESGQKKWEQDISGDVTEFTDIDGPMYFDGNRLYAASYGAGVAALDRSTGEVLWKHDLSNVASMSYAEGKIYTTIASGRVLALDADKGAPSWGFKLSHFLPVEVQATTSYLFVSTSGGPLYVLDRMTGYPLLTWNPSTGFNTQVTLSSRAGFLVSNKGYLYAFRVAY